MGPVTRGARGCPGASEGCGKRTGVHKGELAWMPLQHWRVLRTLHNPRKSTVQQRRGRRLRFVESDSGSPLVRLTIIHAAGSLSDCLWKAPG
jgi:hypothetical protein